jgi:hypothetical protein
MEEELNKAKASGKQEDIKLHAAAIKSLCDVILASEPGSPNTNEIEAPAKNTVDQTILHQLMGAEGSRKFKEAKKKETNGDGANGDSIFDF